MTPDEKQRDIEQYVYEYAGCSSDEFFRRVRESRNMNHWRRFENALSGIGKEYQDDTELGQALMALYWDGLEAEAERYITQRHDESVRDAKLDTAARAYVPYFLMKQAD